MNYLYKFSQLFRIFSINQLDCIIDFLKVIRTNKFNKTYKVVKVYPGKRIEHIIKEETKLWCYFVPHEYGRGTHVIVIPIKQWTPELENELIRKYDK